MTVVAVVPATAIWFCIQLRLVCAAPLLCAASVESERPPLPPALQISTLVCDRSTRAPFRHGGFAAQLDWICGHPRSVHINRILSYTASQRCHYWQGSEQQQRCLLAKSKQPCPFETPCWRWPKTMHAVASHTRTRAAAKTA
jgi:hypothetical protein